MKAMHDFQRIFSKIVHCISETCRLSKFRLGEGLARLGLRTLFILEGGYAVREIGENVAQVLRGFEDAAA